jgi:hypothetical protein
MYDSFHQHYLALIVARLCVDTEKGKEGEGEKERRKNRMK